jgi:hypothetical protein
MCKKLTAWRKANRLSQPKAVAVLGNRKGAAFLHHRNLDDFWQNLNLKNRWFLGRLRFYWPKTKRSEAPLSGGGALQPVAIVESGASTATTPAKPCIH